MSLPAQTRRSNRAPANKSHKPAPAAERRTVPHSKAKALAAVPPCCRNVVRWMELVAKLKEFAVLLNELDVDGCLDVDSVKSIKSAVDDVRQELLDAIPVEL